MNWFKENSFLAGLAALTVFGGGALVFLMMQSMSHYQETSDAYGNAVQKLHILQNRSPFPSPENFQKSRALKEQYESELDALRAQLAKMQTPVTADVQPQRFQDDLRTAVNLITEKAATAGVELPKGFYFGFSQYANSLPNERAAPVLARQLGIINKIVTSLIDFRVQSIDRLDRLPLPEESTASPAPQQTEGGRQRGKEPETNPSGIKRLPFDLGFTAEQGKLRVAFNSLLDSDQFLIVRNLTLQNTARVGPPISRGPSTPPGFPTTMTTPADQSSGVMPGVQGSPAAASELNVILGRELVKASMRIEIIDFSTPEHPKM